MKDKRTIIDVNDFSGGLLTSVPITSMDTKFSPDCINVFNNGSKLKKRQGFEKLNTNTVAAGSLGFGIFNWVKSGVDQLLMAVFGAQLYKMDIDGTVWDGTFDTVSAHSTSGTPLSDSITHFATYAGTLIFVQENRTHPQKMLATDASHFNIESGGTGTAPDGKYIQVWKEHVWILNLTSGGDLDEDMAASGEWSDDDVGGGASTQATTDGRGVMKLVGLSGASASHAIRTRDIGEIKQDYVVELVGNAGNLEVVSGTSTSLGHAIYQFGNGTVDLIMRFTQSSLELYDGTSFNEVAVGIVAESIWNKWEFIVTGGTLGTATCSVLKDGTYIGVGLDISNAASLNDGSIDLTAQAGTGTGATSYIDSLKINSINPEVEYFTDVTLSAWDSGTVPTTPNLVAEPVKALIHYKLNDDTTSPDIAANGIEATTANVFANDTTVDTDQVNGTGKISGSITFTSASSHNIQLATATWQSMSDDNVGSITAWIKPDTEVTGEILSLGDTDANIVFDFSLVGGRLFLSVGTLTQLQTPTTTITTGSYIHVAVTQDATSAVFYVNGVETSFTIIAGSGSQGVWLVYTCLEIVNSPSQTH